MQRVPLPAGPDHRSGRRVDDRVFRLGLANDVGKGRHDVLEALSGKRRVHDLIAVEAARVELRLEEARIFVAAALGDAEGLRGTEAQDGLAAVLEFGAAKSQRVHREFAVVGVRNAVRARRVVRVERRHGVLQLQDRRTPNDPIAHARADLDRRDDDDCQRACAQDARHVPSRELRT